MDGAIWDGGRVEVGWAEAEDVGAGDRAVRGAEDVADDAANPSVRAAERFDGARVVVRLALDGDRRAGGELDDARVPDEGADDPR